VRDNAAVFDVSCSVDGIPKPDFSEGWASCQTPNTKHQTLLRVTFTPRNSYAAWRRIIHARRATVACSVANDRRAISASDFRPRPDGGVVQAPADHGTGR